MHQFTTFAGFVCDYSQSTLRMRYFGALAIVTILVLLITRLWIWRFKSTPLRVTLIIIMLVLAFVGWHFLYWVFIDGNVFGCSISPFVERR